MSKKSRSDKINAFRDRPHTNPYEVLGVERTADFIEIKKAYRALAQEHHPDKNPNDQAAAEAKFKEIAEAYEVLSDPETRALFDLHGVDGLRRTEKKAKKRRVWKDDEDENVFIGNYGGSAHYHFGRVEVCVVCGHGLTVESLSSRSPLAVSDGRSVTSCGLEGTLPGGAFQMPSVAKG